VIRDSSANARPPGSTVHDFRSPLTAIVTAAGALAHSEPLLDDADRRELTETILAETLSRLHLPSRPADDDALPEVWARAGDSGTVRRARN